MVQLVHCRQHQQTEARRLRALGKGSLQLHLPHHQPGQLRVPRASALPVRAALPLLAPRTLSAMKNRPVLNCTQVIRFSSVMAPTAQWIRWQQPKRHRHCTHNNSTVLPSEDNSA